MSFSSFEKLLSPLSLEEFTTNYFGKKPVLIKGDSDKFKEVINWSELNNMLGQVEFWTPDNFKLIKKGQTAPPQTYCRQAASGDMRPTLRPDWNLVKPELKNGATIGLYFVQSFSKQLREITQLIEEAFCARVQMNIYSSWAKGKGLAPHFDTHDVFAMHIEGKKQWCVYDNNIELPIAHGAFSGEARMRMDSVPRKPIMEFMMEPGSILYIPRGYYHDALSLSPGCFHITAGVHYPVGFDIMNSVWSRLGNDPLFRKPLAGPGKDGSETALKNQINTLANAIRKHLKDPALVDQVKAIRDNFRTERTDANLPDEIFPKDN